MVRCAYQQRRELHCIIKGLLPAVVLEELVGIGGVPAPNASAMLGTASPALPLLLRCTAARQAGAPDFQAAHPWMSMPLSCGASRSMRPLLSSDRSAAFCRAAQPARRAETAAWAGRLLRLRSHLSLRVHSCRVYDDEHGMASSHFIQRHGAQGTRRGSRQHPHLCWMTRPVSRFMVNFEATRASTSSTLRMRPCTAACTAVCECCAANAAACADELHILQW